MMENQPQQSKPSEKLLTAQANEQRKFVFYRNIKVRIRHELRVLTMHTLYRYKQLLQLAQIFEQYMEQKIKAENGYEKYFCKILNTSFL